MGNPEKQINIEDFDDPYSETKKAQNRYRENLNRQIANTREEDNKSEKENALEHINRLRLELDAKAETEQNRVNEIRKQRSKMTLEEKIAEDLESKRRAKK